MTRDLATLRTLLGIELEGMSAVSGGDIGSSYRVTCRDGRALFAKRYDSSRGGPRSATSIAQAEADGLRWLAEARSLRTPSVVAASQSNPSWIVLEWIDPGMPAPDFDEALGRGLAALHSSGAPSFGHETDNFIGRLEQSNEPEADWPEFYGRRRLLPQLDLARHNGHLSDDFYRRGCSLIAKLPSLLPGSEPPARLHGDLWSGNLLADESGRPCLIDPAVYGGHREMDLSMMKLFGGFSSRVFAAYREVAPLLDGSEERVALNQLYPLLVHVNLFAGSYVDAVDRVLRHYA